MLEFDDIMDIGKILDLSVFSESSSFDISDAITPGYHVHLVGFGLQIQTACLIKMYAYLDIIIQGFSFKGKWNTSMYM